MIFLNPCFSQVKWSQTINLPIEKQFENDGNIILKTLFPNNPNEQKILKRLSPDEKKLVEAKTKFYKKLILLTALGDFNYTNKDNDSQTLIS
jgi:hypothetical protein